jgi:hypothetical protein
MIEWYWSYLIVGVYVAIMVYGNSIRYKIKHRDYVRVNPLVTWKIAYGFPITAIIWPIIIIGASFEMMRSMHLKQKLNRLEYKEVE